MKKLKKLFNTIVVLLLFLLPQSYAAAPFAVKLSWTDNSDNEDGFIIERSVNKSTFAQLAKIGPDVTSYDDAAISRSSTQDTEYCYRLAAFNTGGSSAYTPTVCGIVGRTVPIGPSALVIEMPPSDVGTELRIQLTPSKAAQSLKSNKVK